MAKVPTGYPGNVFIHPVAAGTIARRRKILHSRGGSASPSLDNGSHPVSPAPSVDNYDPTGVRRDYSTTSRRSSVGSALNVAISARSDKSESPHSPSPRDPTYTRRPSRSGTSPTGLYDGPPGYGYDDAVHPEGSLRESRWDRYINHPSRASSVAGSIKQGSRTPSPSRSVPPAGSAAPAIDPLNGNEDDSNFVAKAAGEGRRDSVAEEESGVSETAIPLQIPVWRTAPRPYPAEDEEGDYREPGPHDFAASVSALQPISSGSVKESDVDNSLPERTPPSRSRPQSPSRSNHRRASTKETLPHDGYHAPDNVCIPTRAESDTGDTVRDALSALSEKIEAVLPNYTEKQGSTIMSALRDLESVIGDQGNASVSIANASSMSPPPSHKTGRQFASRGGYAGYEDDQGSDENEMQSQQPKGGKRRPIRLPAPGQGERMGRRRPIQRAESNPFAKFDSKGAKLPSPFMARLKADRHAAEKAAAGPPDALASLSVPGASPADDEERR
jgi:hypothetical protein